MNYQTHQKPNKGMWGGDANNAINQVQKERIKCELLKFTN